MTSKTHQAEKINDFGDIDADKLTLCRVSNSVVPVNKHKPIVLDEFESVTELDPTDDVSDVFADQPPKKHLTSSSSDPRKVM